MILGPQIVSLHTVSGVQLYQFPASDYESLNWRRGLCEVSSATVVVPTALVETITPWLHWISVWDEHGTALLWTGPVQSVKYGRDSTTIDAKDIAALLGRTRVPITKAWEATDPAVIAAELWKAMIETQRLSLEPIVRRDPLVDVFNYACTADVKMLDKLMDDLVGVGLSWTVVAGTVLLGPAPRTAMAALGEDDFVESKLELVRDGSQVFTDVLVRSATDQVRARINTGGLNLQTIVDQDSLFGLSNAERAASQYLRYTSSMREAVTLDSAARLHPAAPLGIENLVPSARVTVSAYGMLTLMELHSVEVNASADDITVAVGLESVNDNPPELIKGGRQQG